MSIWSRRRMILALRCLILMAVLFTRPLDCFQSHHEPAWWETSDSCDKHVRINVHSYVSFSTANPVVASSPGKAGCPCAKDGVGLKHANLVGFHVCFHHFTYLHLLHVGEKQCQSTSYSIIVAIIMNDTYKTTIEHDTNHAVGFWRGEVLSSWHSKVPCTTTNGKATLQI